MTNPISQSIIRFVVLLLIGGIVFEWSHAPCAAARKDGSWSRYRQGTWIRTETTTKDIDANGRVSQERSRSVRTVMDYKDATQCRLTDRTETEVEGFRIQADPRTYSSPVQTVAEIVRLNEGSLAEGVLDFQTRTVDCKIRRESFVDGDRELIRIEYFNADVYPYILRREIRQPASGTEPEKVLKKSEVLEVDIPEQMFGDTCLCVLVRTTEIHDDGSTVVLETTCPKVPGELVRRSEVKRDSNGRVVRQSATELVEFGWDARDSDTLEPNNDFNWRRIRIRRIRARRGR